MATLTEHEGTRGATRRVNCTIKGVRRTICLGKMNKKAATTALLCIEDLIAGTPDSDTRRWLQKIPAKLRKRLAELGIAEDAEAAADLTLTQLIAEFKAVKYPPKGYAYSAADRENGVERIGYKPGTVELHDRAFVSILKHWPGDTKIRKLTAGDCIELDAKLRQDGLRDATARKRCSIASKLLRHALLKGYLTKNPFEGSGVKLANVATKQQKYIPKEVGFAVIDHLPDNEWRLLFALCRFAGLRVGSEPRQLRWKHVNWTANKLVIPSPKTEHHDGRDVREAPLFGLLRPFLEDRLAVAEANDEAGLEDHVLPFLRRRTDASLRKTVIRAIGKAGHAQWPRLWHNLRGSCQTDLMQENPDDLQGVCNWLGNSLEIAIKHYWKSTGNAFDRAVAQEAPPKALPKALHHSPAPADTGAASDVVATSEHA